MTFELIGQLPESGCRLLTAQGDYFFVFEQFHPRHASHETRRHRRHSSRFEVNQNGEISSGRTDGEEPRYGCPMAAKRTQVPAEGKVAAGAPLGPGALLWETAGDPRSLLPGLATGIIQLMLPGLGAGVMDHSDFFDDPYDRIFRSVPFIWGSILAPDEDEGIRRGHQIRDFHPHIKGTDHHGNRYHALDPEVYWWAHATFTWEFFRTRELYFPIPLSSAQKNQMYAESVTWYRRYGVSERAMPATYSEFRRRFDEICGTQLELTPAVQWVLDPTSNPATDAQPLRLPGLLAPLSAMATERASDLLRVMVYGNMPDIVRRRFGFPWSNTDRATFLALCAAFRGLDLPIRRGALRSMFPEGTPYTDPADSSRVVLAGPNPRQQARQRHKQGVQARAGS